MYQDYIFQLKQHQRYCGRPFNRLNIEFMPFSGKYSAQFYGCDFLQMFTIYAPTYELLISDISELINEVNRTK